MQELAFHIRGLAPLIVHNGQLADPINKWTIAIAEISGKRKKTIADHQELARREWFGGLYLNDQNQPIIPAANLESMLRKAGTKTKDGKNVLQGLRVPHDALIIYKGPRDLDKMWEGGEFSNRATVGINRSKVIRTRPMWKEWELKFAVIYDEDILNSSQVRSFVETAGLYIGLGEWGPKYGRFEMVQ